MRCVINHVELYTQLRELVGNADPNQVTNRQLDLHLVAALDWLVAQLKYTSEVDPTFALIAEQSDFPLPRDMAWIISVEWNGQKLEATTTYRLDREGTNWRYLPSGNPAQFAWIQGDRHVSFIPKPSAAAVGLAPFAVIRYVSSTPGLDAAGTPQLGDLDQQLVLYRAAVRYLRSHITQENAQAYKLRIDEYNSEVTELMPAAKRRADNPVLDYFPAYQVQSDRFRGAR